MQAPFLYIMRSAVPFYESTVQCIPLCAMQSPLCTAPSFQCDPPLCTSCTVSPIRCTSCAEKFPSMYLLCSAAPRSSPPPPSMYWTSCTVKSPPPVAIQSPLCISCLMKTPCIYLLCSMQPPPPFIYLRFTTVPCMYLLCSAVPIHEPAVQCSSSQCASYVTWSPSMYHLCSAISLCVRHVQCSLWV